MNRRRLLRVSGSGLAIAVGGLAGCLGSSDETPPPRESTVFDDISIVEGTMEIALVSEPEVESRADNVDAPVATPLVPIGLARAGSRSSSSGSGSSGATSRGNGVPSSAPTGRHGWAIYGASSGSHWRDNHDDELETYRATIATLGVSYMGSNDAYQAESPGPEPADWDEEWSDPELGSMFEVDLPGLSADGQGETETESEIDAGWYRVGTHLESPDGDTDFGWQAADFKLEQATSGWTIDEAWHVRPRV
ncbi:hypothetical protein [Natrialba aegyptia]|uniref:Uncharacterized protein n=1 Tax=Natrialba aegyptia DSM 13077 TaxID=1227491 RepID=M0B9A0_9EURY|nr:hypothetical protein [Natrialba aegyptia]ELZ07037.1 hypothetical protein C480_08437 [Natrialba aegyptia DSM 13077]